MRTSKLLYVFSFILVLFLHLNLPGFAQEKALVLKGSATWYGDQYHGQKTSSGEVYNKNHLTAAHPSLPFGTKVKVTNALTQHSVIVRINDRGPFGKKGYIIDLSEAAAHKIKLQQSGYGKVTLQIVPASYASAPDDLENLAPLLPAPGDSLLLANKQYFVIQAGSFSDLYFAKLQSDKLKNINQTLQVTLNEETIKGKKTHRVIAGQYKDREEAEKIKAQLLKKGIPVLIKQVPAAS